MYESKADTIHHRYLVRQQLEAVGKAKRAWDDVSPDWIEQTWAPQVPYLVTAVSGAQERVAASALVTSAASLEPQKSWSAPKAFLDPKAFRGATGFGTSLTGMLSGPALRAKHLIAGGMSPAEALAQAGEVLTMIVATTIADIARSAASIGTAMRPGTGYVRIVHGDACDRCLILAGKWYRWNAGFERHPRCQCSHEPAHLSADLAAELGMFDDPYAAFKSLTEAEQNRTFGKARARAIRDGADIFQVVGSKRGMTKNGLFTTAGTIRGNAKGLLKPGQRRATPELIYRWAGGSREKAKRLLEEHGYILPGGQNPLGSLRGQKEGFGSLGRGGTRKAASDAVLLARETGVRDPLNRYTMTAAERRVYDAERDWMMVLQGRNPYASGGFGNIPDPRGLGLNKIGAPLAGPLTPELAIIAEKRYLAVLTGSGK